MLASESQVSFAVYDYSGSIISGELVASHIHELAPDVIFTGLLDNPTDGEKMIQLLHSSSPHSSITVISTDSAARDAAVLLKAGAHGYLHVDDISRELLLEMVRHARDKRLVLKTGSLSALLNVMDQSSTNGGPTTVHVTRRELDVVGLVANGLTNGLIGDQLGISADAVKTHVSNLMRKFNARSRAHLAAMAIGAGIAQLEAGTQTDGRARSA
jgi:DNA-binding NarL/FixJ family response regulator